MRCSLRRALALPALTVGALLVGVMLFVHTAGAGQVAVTQPDLGPNVVVFDPSMSTSQIQTTVDAIATQQVDNEMGSQRYALLFKPGTYGTAANPLIVQVGYYTDVAGLGASPTDVVINGHVDVLQPVPHRRQLHRAEQLLALGVESDDQRQPDRQTAERPVSSGPRRRRRRCGESTSLAETSR